jgi:xylan 1,4-beta-xylosidase
VAPRVFIPHFLTAHSLIFGRMNFDMKLGNLLIVLCVFGYSTFAADTFQNPIVSGFHPDPSICRVGDDYYLVNSSFEFFPGVPIFHSKDLLHWEQIGYCLTRKSQLNLNHARASGGIYAPTIRYHDGTFYMITTLVDSGGNFYVTAKNPAGPWSDPIWVDRPGIDPSLFFDDDGSVYYTRHEGMGDGYIAQGKIDIKTGKLEGPLKEIWRGTGDVWPEGPHLYKVHGKYFLVIAEGGTSYNHMVTVARSDSPWGPFTSNPKNPILTHRNRSDSPFQALGHSDLVETPAGWWLVFLGIRPQGGQFHHLGRETFLAPVSWSDDGWPVVNGGAAITSTMPSPKLPEHPWKKAEPKDEFDKAQLGLQWNYLRNPYEEDYSLSEKPGSLRLKGSAVTLDDKDSPAFVGRRQTDLTFHASTRLSFNPQHENEEAGLVLRGNEKNHYELGVTFKNGKRQIFLRKTLNGKLEEPFTNEIGAGDITLVIAGTPLEYRFSYRLGDQAEKELNSPAATRDLSSEKVGGFTGVFIGMYATGNKQKSTSPADFDWFEYQSENP